MSQQPEVDKSTDSKKAKELFYKSAKRLGLVTYPEAGMIACGIAAVGVNAVTNLSFPYIMGKAVDIASAGIATSPGKERDEQKKFLVTAIGVVFIGSVASWVRVYCLGTSTDRIALRLRRQLYNCYLETDVELFDQKHTGELMTVIDKDVAKAAETYTSTLASACRSLNSAVNGSVLLFTMSPSLCLVSLSVCPIVGIGSMFLSKYSRKVANTLRELEGKVTSYVLERLEGMTTVRVNNREKTESLAYEKFTGDCCSLSASTHFAQGAFMSFINLATNLSLMAVLSFGGVLIAQKKMTAGNLTRFAMTSGFVGLGFAGLSTVYTDCRKSIDAAERVFSQMDRNKISSREDSDGQRRLPESLSKEDKEGILINDIHFSYRSRADITVLNGLSLKISQKNITAIVGRSGSGKSTLLSLICGLYKQDSDKAGSSGIWIDGEPIDSLGNALKGKIGVVEQNACLFSGTIFENIAYGKFNASQDNVQQAAKLAVAEDFIMALPDKFDTQVGTNGNLLSGGQKVRVALARALISQPSYLLLDEFSAALDKESELEIIKILYAISATMGIVTFTHSPHVMEAASVVCIIKNGKVEATGSYAELKSQLLSAE